MRNLFNKLKSKNKFGRLKNVLQKEYDIDYYIKKSIIAVFIKTKHVCVKLKHALHKEYDIDFHVKKLIKAFIRIAKNICVKLNYVLHKEVDMDYYVKKSFKTVTSHVNLARVKLKRALYKEYDLDYHVIKLTYSIFDNVKQTRLRRYYLEQKLKSLAYRVCVYMIRYKRLLNSPCRHIIRAAAALLNNANIIFISLAKFAASKRLIIKSRIKQSRNDKVKSRIEQERENIAFLTEFLNSLKEEFGADISFSLLSVNSDEDEFIAINEH